MGCRRRPGNRGATGGRSLGACVQARRDGRDGGVSEWRVGELSDGLRALAAAVPGAATRIDLDSPALAVVLDRREPVSTSDPRRRRAAAVRAGSRSAGAPHMSSGSGATRPAPTGQLRASRPCHSTQDAAGACRLSSRPRQPTADRRLAMVLAHHERAAPPLEVLRDELGAGRDGVSALDLRDAAKRYGLTCRGLRTDIETVRSLRRSSSTGREPTSWSSSECAVTASTSSIRCWGGGGSRLGIHRGVLGVALMFSVTSGDVGGAFRHRAAAVAHRAAAGHAHTPSGCRHPARRRGCSCCRPRRAAGDHGPWTAWSRARERRRRVGAVRGRGGARAGGRRADPVRGMAAAALQQHVGRKLTGGWSTGCWTRR